PLALHPECGSPKNLPVVHKLPSDIENPKNATLATKPHFIIVGGGWGAVGVLQNLHPGNYYVTIMSLETYATFTPLLPSVAVGTVQICSLVKLLWKIVARLWGHFLSAKAMDLVMYDKLIIAVGSTSAIHGVNGLEHCFQLKATRDVRLIRQQIIDNFEQASLPTTSPEEHKRLLSFIVCGGGPTGVETAAEIYNLCQEDIMNYYPKIHNRKVSIHVIQSREHILNT
ncbi:hypothetical protein OBBRIDRAFT_709668, partial [Obba rivulosa]